MGPPYYSQRAMFASPLSAFSFNVFCSVNLLHCQILARASAKAFAMQKSRWRDSCCLAMNEDAVRNPVQLP